MKSNLALWLLVTGVAAEGNEFHTLQGFLRNVQEEKEVVEKEKSPMEVVEYMCSCDVEFLCSNDSALPPFELMDMNSFFLDPFFSTGLFFNSPPLFPASFPRILDMQNEPPLDGFTLILRDDADGMQHVSISALLPPPPPPPPTLFVIYEEYVFTPRDGHRRLQEVEEKYLYQNTHKHTCLLDAYQQTLDQHKKHPYHQMDLLSPRCQEALSHLEQVATKAVQQNQREELEQQIVSEPQVLAELEVLSQYTSTGGEYYDSEYYYYFLMCLWVLAALAIKKRYTTDNTNRNNSSEEDCACCCCGESAADVKNGEYALLNEDGEEECCSCCKGTGVCSEACAECCDDDDCCSEGCCDDDGCCSTTEKKKFVKHAEIKIFEGIPVAIV